MEQYKPEIKQIFDEAIEIWKNSNDKKAVEKMFYLTTGIEFEIMYNALRR